MLLRVLFAVALAAMPFLSAWQQWMQRRERAAVVAVLQLVWWLAEGGPVLATLRSAFRGSARCGGTKAIRPRRARFSFLARPA
ncbi:MAG: hypothetical protein EOO36_07690 [Cytophagaceae bacterium]|nr:MAG: hypothetical protein EOO36_07690 [Cytophagaceae bacterium]